MARESGFKSSYVPSEVRSSVVTALLAVQEAHGLPTWRVRAVATDLGVSPRTLWRWLEAAKEEGRTTRRPRARFVVDEQAVVDLARHNGNVSAVHLEWTEAGREVPSIGTLRRAYAAVLPPGRRAGLKEGERARRDFDTYLSGGRAQHRNECWESDHTQLAVKVVLPDERVVSPWLTLFIDQAHRVILGWAVAVTPSQETVLSALRAAVDVEVPHGPMGGVPTAIRFDRGKEFLAEAVGLAAASLAIDARALPAYTPHLKGTVERANGSIEQLFLAQLPGFTHGPRGRDGRLVDDGPLLGLEALVELFAAFVTDYNTRRPHQGLAGRTPEQAWTADATPLTVVPPRHLRHLLLARAQRKVGKRGIRLDGRVYNCAELCGWVGETVEVRYMPRHTGEVEVFRGGEHLGTAICADELRGDEISRLLAHRAREAAWLARTQRAATRARQARYAALTSPGPMSASDRPTRAAATVEESGLDHLGMARAASRSLVEHGEVPAHMLRATGRTGDEAGQGR